MKGLGNYETMIEIGNDLDKKMYMLKMQLAQNYVSMIAVKKSLYDYSIFGFSNLHKALSIVDTYIRDRFCGSMPEEDRKTAKSYHDVLMSGIEGATGIKVKEICNIYFMFDETYFEICFLDDRNNRLSISVPDVNNAVYDITAQDIDIGFGYDKFHNRCKTLLDGLDTTLYLVASETDHLVKKETVTSFPDKVSDISEFKKAYEQYLLAREGVVLC